MQGHYNQFQNSESPVLIIPPSFSYKYFHQCTKISLMQVVHHVISTQTLSNRLIFSASVKTWELKCIYAATIRYKGITNTYLLHLPFLPLVGYRNHQERISMAQSDFPDEVVQGNEYKKMLASAGVEFLVSTNGMVPWSAIEGKTICLFFSANWCRPCRAFIPQLVQLYNALNENDEKLEIVFVSSDKDENAYKEHFGMMPWLATTFNLDIYKSLTRRFNVNHIPALIPLGLDGKTVEEDATSLVEDYGADAFPFTRKKREEMRAIDERKRSDGKIEELLTNGGRDYLISSDNRKILVCQLIGKTIGLYFGAHWCPPVHNFTSQLIETYIELKTHQNQPFEVVFVSTDRNHDEFISSLSTMPWLAIPYNDKTRQDLKRVFDIKGIPTLVLIGPDGKTISTNGRAMVSLYGAMAFPFTELRIAGIEATLRKEGEMLPRKVQDPKHVDHELKLDMAKAYICDACKKKGKFWAFSCDVCDYDLHPGCLEETF